ncbi:MAG: hypothetical protein ACHRXM_09430 [Isosphaerales bacterium]
MSWIPGFYGDRRRQRVKSVRWTVEVLETRALLADGITATPGLPIAATVGIPITNAVLASYTVTDPSGEPGTQWRALINFGDGHSDGPLIPGENGGSFQFVDTHTYNAPGMYTITVMIAVPGSQKPNDNRVTTQVTVSSSTTTPPPPAPLDGSGLNSRVRENKTFRGNVARFGEPHTKAEEFQAIINWGDQSAPTPGLIHARGRGRFVVVGSHRYVTPGVYHVAVKIQAESGRELVTESLVRVVK